MSSNDLSTVEIQGTYQRVSENPAGYIPEVNSCIIECFKKENVCREYIAKYSQPSAESDSSGRYTLFLIKQEFSIVSWKDNGQIIADAETRAMDLGLIIDIKEKKVLRTAQETDTRGAQWPKDEPDVWIIEDKASDFEFREGLLKLLDLLP